MKLVLLVILLFVFSSCAPHQKVEAKTTEQNFVYHPEKIEIVIPGGNYSVNVLRFTHFGNDKRSTCYIFGSSISCH